MKRHRSWSVWIVSAGCVAFLIAGCEQEQESAKSGGESETSSNTTTDQAKSPSEATVATMEIDVPLGLPPVPVPDDNPMTEAKVELGKLLYFDGRLSKEGDISCATCHNPEEGWAERKPVSEGIGRQKGGRNAPTVINAAYMTSQFWDGREPTLEKQALGPIQNPIEMGNTMEACIEELASIPEYQERFQAVFGTEVTEEGIAKAIAAFERTVLSGNSAYDKYEAGDKDALTESQQRGLDIFTDKGMCSTCHTPPTFSNGQFYNAGIGMDAAEPDEGRKDATGKESDFGKFRVPMLRDITDTSPYFHNGSVTSLEEAVRIMAGGGKDNENLSGTFKVLRPVEFSEQDIQDLVAFLQALSGDYPRTETPELPKAAD